MNNQFKVFCLILSFLCTGIHAMHQQESASKRVELNDEFKEKIRAVILAELAAAAEQLVGVRVERIQELFDHILDRHAVDDHKTMWEKLLGYVAHYGFIKPVRMLIEAGVNVNAAHPSGATALYSAVSGGHLGIILMLIQAGAYLNPVSVDCGPVLVHAAYNAPYSDTLTCELLVEKMLSLPNASQKERVYTFLNCLKCMDATIGVGSYCHLRNVFKPYLQTMIREENMPWVRVEIEKIDGIGSPKRSRIQLIKQQLLNKYIDPRVVEESERML